MRKFLLIPHVRSLHKLPSAFLLSACVGWDKWSSDRALHTEYVLIIGTPEWFACLEKTQPAGTGLGTANEADDIRHLINKAAGVIGHIRVVLFDDADAAHIPAKLDRYHRFRAERDENFRRARP